MTGTGPARSRRDRGTAESGPTLEIVRRTLALAATSAVAVAILLMWPAHTDAQELVDDTDELVDKPTPRMDDVAPDGGPGSSSLRWMRLEGEGSGAPLTLF